MTAEEHKTLQQLRYLLRKSGCFAFEKNGKYLLYREGQPGAKNHLVLSSTNITKFYSEARKAAGV